MYRSALFAALVATAALSAPAPAAAELSLDRNGVLALALQNLRGGEPAKTLALAEAVLKVNPDDVTALILKARALRDLGRYREAQTTARLAWSKSGSSPEARYGASMAMAQALSSDGKRIQAQFWLRRAYQFASSDGERVYAAEGYRFVKGQNPWSFSGSFSVAPNSNINNGSSADVIWILGLPFTPVVYSGITAEASASASYRLLGANGSQTTLGLSLYGTLNWLDPASRTLMASAGGAGASPQDFDYLQIGANLSHLRPVGADGQVLQLNAGIGTSFYGWQHYAELANVGVELRSPLSWGKGDMLALFANARAQFPAAPGDRPIYSFEAGARLSHNFTSGDSATVTLAATRAVSATASQQFHGLRGAVEWHLGRPVLGADLTFSIDGRYRNYPVSSFVAGARRDLSIGADVEAAFPVFEYMGFIPVATAGIERSYSNVPAYATDRIKFGLGLRSRF